MDNNTAIRIAVALERIADALEAKKARQEARKKPQRSEYSPWREKLTAAIDGKTGVVKMNDILGWMGLDPEKISHGQRQSIGHELGKLGVRRHKTNVSWLYIFD